MATSYYASVRSDRDRELRSYEAQTEVWLKAKREGGMLPDFAGGMAASRQSNMFGGSGSRDAQSYSYFRQTVYACVNFIAKRLAGQPWSAGELTNAERDDKKPPKKSYELSLRQPWMKHTVAKSLLRRNAPNQDLDVFQSHAILDTIDRPNPLQRRSEFMYMSVASLLLTGVCYWVGGKVKGKKTPNDKQAEGDKIEVWAIPSHLVTPLHTDGLFSAYKIKMSAQDTAGIEIPAANVARTYIPDPSDITGVFSPLNACIRAIRTDDHVQGSQEGLFARGLMPHVGVVIGEVATQQFAPILSGAQRHQIERMIIELYNRTTNDGMPAIFDGMIKDIKRLDPMPREMDWKVSGEIVRDRILRAYGISLLLLGDTQGGNRAQAVMAEENAAANVFNPLADTFTETACEWLAPMFEPENTTGRIWVWINPFKAHDEEMTQREWDTARKNSDVDRNEYRAERLGLPPLEDQVQKSALVETVGGVQGAIAVSQAVGQGVLEPEQAQTIFQQFFGLDANVAKQLAGEKKPQPPAPGPGQGAPGFPAAAPAEKPAASEEQPAVEGQEEFSLGGKRVKHGDHDQSTHGRGGGGTDGEKPTEESTASFDVMESLGGKGGAEKNKDIGKDAADFLNDWVRIAEEGDKEAFGKMKERGKKWVEGGEDKALTDVYNNTQSKLKAAGIKEVQTFRGIPFPPDHPIVEKLRSGELKPGDEISLSENDFSSWSDDVGAAERFAGFTDDSVVVSRVIPAEDVVASHRTQYGFFRGEGEVIARSPKEVKLKIVSAMANGKLVKSVEQTESAEPTDEESAAKAYKGWVTTEDGVHLFIGSDGVPRVKPGGKPVEDEGGDKPNPAPKPADKPSEPKPEGDEKPAASADVDKDRLSAIQRTTSAKLKKVDGELIRGRRMAVPPKVTGVDAVKAVDAYTGDEVYDKVNKALRSGKSPEDVPPKPAMEHLQELASQPLKKPVVVYRGVSKAIADSMVDGSDIEGKGFTSTSLSSDVASKFAKGGGVILEIKAKRGLYVRDKSQFSDEYELIQAHKTKYKVIGRREHAPPLTETESLLGHTSKPPVTVLMLEEI